MRPIRTQFVEARHEALTRAKARESRRATKLRKWRTQRHRRALVLVLGLGGLLMISGTVVGYLGAGWWQLVLSLSGLLTGATFWFLLRIVTGRAGSSAPPAVLDERERELRYRAISAGFQVMTAVMLFAMLFQLYIGEVDGVDESAAMLSNFLLIGLATPNLVLGWTLPDDYPEELSQLNEDDPIHSDRLRHR